MNDEEYRQTQLTCTSMILSFVLFPAFCFITILFGYVWAGFIAMEAIVGAIILPCFIARTVFLIRYNRYATKRRLLFETIAYIACIAFALGTAVLVKDEGGIFTYYPFNIYIQPLYMIFVLVVMGYHIGTYKKVAKTYQNEKARRQGKDEEAQQQ